MQKYPNLKYKKNNRNIGGNGNIARAYLEAKKEYIWVICDDDFYCWNSWDEVEKAIEDNCDAIIVSNFDNPKKDVSRFYLQATFVPATIYKTEIFNDWKLSFNMLNNIPNWFPHLAISAKVLNDKLKYYIVNQGIVISGNVYEHVDLPDLETIGIKDSIKKEMTNTYIPDFTKNMSWIVGYANSIKYINDEKTRSFIANNNRFFSNLTSAKLFFINEKEGKNTFYNIACIFDALSGFDRIKFLTNLFLYYTIYRLIYFYTKDVLDVETKETNRKVVMLLFSFIKISIYKCKLPPEKIL